MHDTFWKCATIVLISVVFIICVTTRSCQADRINYELESARMGVTPKNLDIEFKDTDPN